MANSFKIRRSTESKMIYFIVSAFILYKYISLLNDFDFNKTTDLLLMAISSLVLLCYFVTVYTDRIFFFSTHIVIIFAPKLLIAKYDRVEILKSENVQSEKYDYHFKKDEKQIHLKVKNKVYSFSTNNNENVIKSLNTKTGTKTSDTSPS